MQKSKGMIYPFPHESIMQQHQHKSCALLSPPHHPKIPPSPTPTTTISSLSLINPHLSPPFLSISLMHPPPNNSNSSSSSSITPLPPRRQHNHHPSSTQHSPPCGACKFLRRKCVEGCVFSPYFGTEQGAARFAAVHKVFGASNVSKLLLQMPAPRRHDAVLTVCYEAQARLSDPVYGCVSTILALQQQVASLQAELTILQSQVISSRLAVASALQVQGSSSVSEYPILPQHMITVLHPSYSNNSSTSNSMVMNLTSSCFHPSGLDPSHVHAQHEPVSEGLELLHHPSHYQDEDEEAEGESRTSSAVFADTVFHTK